MHHKLPPGTLDPLWANASHWYWGGIYICKADPRYIVPKRTRWTGWTLNFANPKSWIALLLMILLISASLITLARFDLINRLTWFLTLAFILLVTCSVCHWQASPKRYEKNEI